MFCPEKNEINDVVNKCINKYQAGDQSALEYVYDDLLIFCVRVISKTCGRYINRDDEEAGIIPNVMLDVLEKYDSGRGSFMVYLGQAVRNRTIDRMRKEKRMSSIPISSLDAEFKEPSIDNVYFENIIDDIARRQEILKFKKLLADFNLGFEELAQVSPRQAKTREKAQLAAWLIAQDSDLKAFLLKKRVLPNKVLEEKYNINRSILDRYRKYIIAAVLIIVNDFSYLKPYVLPVQREVSQWHELKG